MSFAPVIAAPPPVDTDSLNSCVYNPAPFMDLLGLAGNMLGCLVTLNDPNELRTLPGLPSKQHSLHGVLAKLLLNGEVWRKRDISETTTTTTNAVNRCEVWNVCE